MKSCSLISMNSWWKRTPSSTGITRVTLVVTRRRVPRSLPNLPPTRTPTRIPWWKRKTPTWMVQSQTWPAPTPPSSMFTTATITSTAPSVTARAARRNARRKALVSPSSRTLLTRAFHPSALCLPTIYTFERNANAGLPMRLPTTPKSTTSRNSGGSLARDGGLCQSRKSENSRHGPRPTASDTATK